MRVLSRGLLALLIALPLAVLAALWLALEPAPRVPPAPTVSYADIDRAIRLLQRNDPRGKLPGITRAAALSQRDLELLAQHAGRRFGDLRTRVRLQPGLARVQASLALPEHPLNPFGRWLNLDAVLQQTRALPRVERLRLGRLPVPGWLAEAALPRLLALLELGAQGELAQQLVQQVSFTSQQLVLAYAWPDELQKRLADAVLPPAEQARLQVYVDRLSALSHELGGGTVSMARLLPPLFALAQQRSPDRETARRENRAALVALSLLVSGQGLSALLPTAAPVTRARALRVTLHGRSDTPQHYLVSAALAVEGGSPLADAIGLYKEVADSRGGSGFSFNDLAADRAGTRLGGLAQAQPRALQARLAAGVQEPDLLPPIADLPEAMTAAEFQRRFGGVDGPGYQRMLADIEARLDRLPLLAPAAP